ncbi:hypothetical protein NDU88_006789, partial [Pleurodeles waltl]
VAFFPCVSSPCVIAGNSPSTIPRLHILLSLSHLASAKVFSAFLILLSNLCCLCLIAIKSQTANASYWAGLGGGFCTLNIHFKFAKILVLNVPCSGNAKHPSFSVNLRHCFI